MPDSGQQADGHARLLVIELPWVDVEHGRNALVIVLAERTLHDREWKLAKVAATGRGNAQRAPEARRKRKLQEGAARAFFHERNRRCTGPSVVRATDGKNARVVEV